MFGLFALQSVLTGIRLERQLPLYLDKIKESGFAVAMWKINDDALGRVGYIPRVRICVRQVI